jgi:hypothetical protein
MSTARACSRLLAIALALGGCAGNSFAQSPASDPIGDLIEHRAAGSETPSFEGYLDNLRKASCPGSTGETAQDIDLKVTPVPLQGLNPKRTTVGELTYVAGFQLTSDDARFGGLSGLDLLDDGNLLAISDDGAFVWLDMATDGVTPTKAHLAPLLDAKGREFSGKSSRDAEGLAIYKGLALVSFESNPRVLAYDVGRCGAGARGAPLGWSLSKAFARAKLSVGGNTGVEALAITSDGYLFNGIEMKTSEGSPISARPLEAAPQFNLLEGGDKAPEIVGLDLVAAGKDGKDARAFALHRSTNALASNVITLTETLFTRYLDQAGLPARVVSEIDERSHIRFRPSATRTLAEMNVFLTIDNFEGIAAKEMPDGRIRLFIISDDNFSKRQRTLLMVFDVAASSNTGRR